MTEETGKSFVILNRGGAGGTLGAKVAAASDPDGYTMLVTTNALVAAPSLFKAAVNPDTDLTPVAQIAAAYLFLVTSTAFPARTVAELVEKIRAAPGTMSFGSAGIGTPIHLAGELFKREASLDLTHVPYAGSAPALQDIIGSCVLFMFDATLSSLPLVKGGALRALAVTAPQRLAELPDAPTMTELGYETVNVGIRYWLLGPKGIPACVVAYYDALTRNVLAEPDVQARIAHLGADSTWFPAEHLRALIRAETPMWVEMVQHLEIKPVN